LSIREVRVTINSSIHTLIADALVRCTSSVVITITIFGALTVLLDLARWCSIVIGTIVILARRCSCWSSTTSYAIFVSKCIIITSETNCGVEIDLSTRVGDIVAIAHNARIGGCTIVCQRWAPNSVLLSTCASPNHTKSICWDVVGSWCWREIASINGITKILGTVIVIIAVCSIANIQALSKSCSNITSIYCTDISIITI